MSEKNRDPIIDYEDPKELDGKYKDFLIEQFVKMAKKNKQLEASEKELAESNEVIRKMGMKVLDKIKQQIEYGLDEQNDPRANIKKALEIMSDSNIGTERLVGVEPKSGTTAKERSEWKPLKLPTATPTFSGRANERLEEWLFKINECFFNLRVVDSVEKLHLATTHVSEGPLKELMAYMKRDKKANWEGFEKLLKSLYEPRQLTLRVRTQLRHLRQKDSIQKYIKRFRELMVQLPNLGEEEALVAFTDGLNDKFRYEVVKGKCKTITEAIECVTELDYCNTGGTEEVNTVKKVNYARFKGGKQNYRFPRSGGTQGFQKRTLNQNNGRVNRKGPYDDPNRVFKKCFRCKKTGHLRKDCRVKLAGDSDDSKGVKEESNGSKEEYRKKWGPRKKENRPPQKSNVLSICNPNMDADSLKCVTGTVNGVEMKMALDSGATCCIISARVARENQFKVLDSEIKIKVATNEVENVVGVTEPMYIDVQGHSCTLELYVINHEDHAVLLGLNWFMATGAQFCPSEGVLRFKSEIVFLESEEKYVGEESTEQILMSELATGADSDDIEGETDWPVSEEHKVEAVEKLNKEQEREFEAVKGDIMRRFAKTYMDLGENKTYEFKIRLSSDQVVFQHPYRKSMKERDEIKEEIKKMLEAKVIRQSHSPWSSPVLVIPKKDGSKRMCVDYRKLNAITVTENWPLPVIRDILDRLSGSTWFSALDLRSGYWQIKMARESIPLTAFSTPDGHYEFLRLPFGLKCAPAHFSRVMHQVLGNLAHVEIYLDDLTVHSSTFSEHMMHIKSVLSALKKAGLKVNSAKCTWCAREIKILGHIVSQKSVSMDPSKIEAVKNRIPPRTVKEVQAYLGLCNYYRRFIKDFSKIAAPLFRLLQKDKKWEWTAECQKAFEDLKDALTSYPILRHPDPSKPFILQTDSSGYAIGAILSQVDNGKEYACGYESRILKNAEIHYGITEKECLAVVFGVKKFRVYLYGTRFRIVSDHSSLLWLMSIRDPTGRLARWSIYLQGYDFEIVHKKGSAHTNVDALSRPPVPMEIKEVMSMKMVEEDELSVKNLDPYDNEALLYYLKHRRHQDGLSRKQVRRVENVEQHFKLEDDELYYRKEVDGIRFLRIPRVDERNELVLRHHLLGHFQAKTTLNRLQEAYYWRNMEATVKMVVSRCLTCLRHQKVPAENHPAQAIEVTGLHDRISMDLIFGLPRTEEGYTGILTIVEALSKRAEAYPIKSKTMEEISGHVWNYICRQGCAKEILTDQGNEFNNKMLHALLSNVGVEHKVTSAYSPRTNGQCEKFNSTLMQALRKHAEENPTMWHKWIDYILMAYNSRVHSVTKFTPFELFFGRKMNGFEAWSTRPQQDEVAALHQRTMEIKRQVEGLVEAAKTNIRKGQMRQREIQDSQNRVAKDVLEQGTNVFLKAEGIIGKLTPRYRGPYKVKEVTRRGNYILENALGEPLEMSVPRYKLKVVGLEEEDGYENCEVEKILDFKKIKDQLVYLVK